MPGEDDGWFVGQNGVGCILRSILPYLFLFSVVVFHAMPLRYQRGFLRWGGVFRVGYFTHAWW